MTCVAWMGLFSKVLPPKARLSRARVPAPGQSISTKSKSTTAVTLSKTWTLLLVRERVWECKRETQTNADVQKAPLPPPPSNPPTPPCLADVLAELGRIDEKKGIFLGQECGGNCHRVEQDIASSDVEQPRHLHTIKRGVQGRGRGNMRSVNFIGPRLTRMSSSCANRVKRARARMKKKRHRNNECKSKSQAVLRHRHHREPGKVGITPSTPSVLLLARCASRKDGGKALLECFMPHQSPLPPRSNHKEAVRFSEGHTKDKDPSHPALPLLWCSPPSLNLVQNTDEV